MSPTCRKIAIIHNRTAGANKSRLFHDVIDNLRANDVTVDIFATQYQGHAQDLAKELKLASYDRICAAGGDGTINEVINGLYPSPLPFGIIPTGTANVLAKVLLPNEKAATISETLLKGIQKPCFPGFADGRYFSLMVSMGPDAEAVACVNLTLKKYLGKAAYGVSFLKQLIWSRPITYEIDVDGKKFQAASVIISKTPYYGGRFICTPKADIDQKLFQICLFMKKGRWAALGYALKMLFNMIPNDPAVQIVSGRNVNVQANHSASYQVDGDYGGTLPVTLSLMEPSLTLLSAKSGLT